METKTLTNVLTLQLDPASEDFFERLRVTHFPPGRNQIPAHLTLFHTLPDSPEILRILREEAALQASFDLQVTGLRSLGKGVAFTLQGPDLHSIHTQLALHFQDHLTPQDRQKFAPHIVVQNKATPQQARALLVDLQQRFTPFQVQAQALNLWHYLGGPWELAERICFRPEVGAT